VRRCSASRAPELATDVLTLHDMTDALSREERDAALPTARSIGALRDLATGCRACDLWARATQTVFGDGSPRARLLIVGEQPGNSEDLEGAPFVGPAGRLLDRALVEAGIDRADVFIASTNGDNTNLVVAQLAKRRFDVPKVIARVLDPRRAAWYAEQGLHTICPTQIAIEQLEKAALEG
jgi:hypothetical protein